MIDKKIKLLLFVSRTEIVSLKFELCRIVSETTCKVFCRRLFLYMKGIYSRALSGDTQAQIDCFGNRKFSYGANILMSTELLFRLFFISQSKDIYPQVRSNASCCYCIDDLS